MIEGFQQISGSRLIVLYFTFADLAFHKSEYSYIPLLFDVLIGFISFVSYHYKNDNFKESIF